jgi:hypothetical protein
MIVKIKHEYKTLADHNDNYTWREDAYNKRCLDCIFVGSVRHEIGCFCGKRPGEIVWVSDCGTCDAHKSAAKWFNRINPIKYMILKNHGFTFRNR